MAAHELSQTNLDIVDSIRSAILAYTTSIVSKYGKILQGAQPIIVIENNAMVFMANSIGNALEDPRGPIATYMVQNGLLPPRSVRSVSETLSNDPENGKVSVATFGETTTAPINILRNDVLRNAVIDSTLWFAANEQMIPGGTDSGNKLRSQIEIWATCAINNVEYKSASGETMDMFDATRMALFHAVINLNEVIQTMERALAKSVEDYFRDNLVI